MKLYKFKRQSWKTWINKQADILPLQWQIINRVSCHQLPFRHLLSNKDKNDYLLEEYSLWCTGYIEYCKYCRWADWNTEFGYNSGMWSLIWYPCWCTWNNWLDLPIQNGEWSLVRDYSYYEKMHYIRIVYSRFYLKILDFKMALTSWNTFRIKFLLNAQDRVLYIDAYKKGKVAQFMILKQEEHIFFN